MAESAVTFLLTTLASILQEEGELQGGFRVEVEWIKDELERIRAFLKVADSIEDDDEEIKVWVRQVREVAYYIQDVIDFFTLRIRHPPPGNCFISNLGKPDRFVKNYVTRRDVASQIKLIRNRIVDISEGFRRYRGKLEMVGSQNSSTVSVYDRRGDALLIEESELVGIDEPKKELVELLLSGDLKLRVVSVVGMGGLGKTTVIKKVYDDPIVGKQFNSHAWINVSQTYILDELLKDVIIQLYEEKKLKVPQRLANMSRHQLKAAINEFLKDKSYLIVLDDVWKVNDWDGFKYAFPKNNYGSRVMLTTRVTEVASRSCIDSQGHVYILKPLSTEKSWTLFCNKLFHASSCPSHLTKISISILKRCEGLPLAIVAISGILSTKDSTKVDDWEMVHRSIGTELGSDDGLKSTTKILSLGFTDLPYYLKSCFLYMSIFPEDCLIERNRLIRLWMAEGFIEETQGKTREEVGDSYLNELVNRNMVQVNGVTIDGRLKTCRVHDLIREILISKSKDHNFIVQSDTTNIPEKVRYISFHNCFQSLNGNAVTRLRSLLMFGRVESSSSSLIKFFLASDGLKILNVLDLRHAPVTIFPKEISELVNLRYLSFRKCNIRKVPDSIGKLRNLETLDLKYTYITELPVTILKLSKLRHLLLLRNNLDKSLASTGAYGFKAPLALGRLSSLQKLTLLHANHDNGVSFMQQIGSLIQLRKLGLSKLRKEDMKDLCACIGKLCNLRSLSLQAIEEDEMVDLQFLTSPPQFLRYLHLGGRLENLPNWIPYAHCLTRMQLYWSRLKSDPLEPLGALLNLSVLDLFRAYDGETLCFKSGGFQKLKEFLLDSSENLTNIIIEENAMVNIEQIYLVRCT